MGDPDVRIGELLLAVAGERSLDAVLRMLVDGARDLAGARYAAIGIPDDESDGFRRFVTSGMSDALIARLGPLPRSHGMLGAMLEEPHPYRTEDITADHRFRGWWPAAHPSMHSFMGIPIVYDGQIVGAFYVTEKIAASRFDDVDERRIAVLAGHTAVAIANARLEQQVRELAVIQERTRLARELHDALSQTLLGLSLSADVAAELATDAPRPAATQLDQIRALARTARRELRAVVEDLQPPDLATDGLTVTLRKHLDMVRRSSGLDVSADLQGLDDLPDAVDRALLRIVQEAVHNAVRHADATRVTVSAGRVDGGVVLCVGDDGHGFDPTAVETRGRHLGLASMRDRAAAVGGTLTLDTGSGRGTRIEVRVDDA